MKGSVRLFLKHTYMPSLPVDFAGSTYFGGNLDQLVLSASKGEYTLLNEPFED